MHPSSGVARIFNRGGQSEGAKRPSGGGGGGGAKEGDFFVENSCMKTAFSSTLNDIIRGVVM